MTSSPLSKSLLILTLGLSVALPACGGAPYQTRPSVVIPPALAEEGDSIYFGRVFPLAGGSTEPLFVYERRVRQDGEIQTATHITRDPAGKAIFADSARHTKSYTLLDYELLGDQLGRTGRIAVSGGKVRFELTSGAETREASETVSDALVVSPTLVGYIIEHLRALRSGATLPVRLAVLERLETIGFDLELVDAPQGRTRVRMKASSLFIRMAIDPITFTFETASSKLLVLEGRVPPKAHEGHRLQNLDARVDYTFIAPAYR